ncbi:hypothetical protein BL470_005527, partial [Escherichia coli]|nr:hypothetical protein [Escherichia coli]
MTSFRRYLTMTGSLVLAATAGISMARAEGVTIDDIMKDAETPADIVSYGLGTKGQRFSPM